MAIKSKDEIMKTIKEKFGDDTSDEALGFIEDVADTIGDFESRASDQTDWKSKYEENDKTWREKYRDRFFSAGDSDGDDDDEEDAPPMKTFADLFSVKEN